MNEKTQPGNPHRLTIRQHYFPVESIKRFADSSGLVEVHQKKDSSSFRIRPNNARFAGKRLWDQKTEFHMKEIEDKYQAMIERMDLDRLPKMYHQDNDAISAMFASWQVRAPFSGFDDATLNLVPDELRNSPKSEWSKNDREQLEAAHYVTTRNHDIVPGRHFAWPYLRREMGKIRHQLKNAKWGILRAKTSNFICPDNFGSLAILPLNPNLLFAIGYEDLTLDTNDVKKFNDLAIGKSKEYYFSRDFSMCPGTG